MLGFHFGGAVAQRDLDAAPVGHANEADREMARARRFIDGPAIVSDLASVIFGKADEELQEIALFKKGDHFQRQTDRTSDVEGKSVQGRVGLGTCRYIKTKTK